MIIPKYRIKTKVKLPDGTIAIVEHITPDKTGLWYHVTGKEMAYHESELKTA